MKSKFEDFLNFDLKKAFDDSKNELEEHCYTEDHIRNPIPEHVFIMFDFVEHFGTVIEIRPESSEYDIQFDFRNKDDQRVGVTFSCSCLHSYISTDNNEEFYCSDPNIEYGYQAENHHNVPASTLNYIGLTQEDVNVLYKIKENIRNFVAQRNTEINEVMEYLNNNEFELKKDYENNLLVETNENEKTTTVYLNELVVYKDNKLSAFDFLSEKKCKFPEFNSVEELVYLLKITLNKYNYFPEIEESKI